MNFEQAWQSVLGQLQMEMPRASFDAWVRDTHVLSFEDGVLTVSVRNAYTRDWLDSRLTSTVSRLLVGTLNTNASVQFVVANGEDPSRSEQALELQTKWEQLIQKLENEQRSYDEATASTRRGGAIQPPKEYVLVADVRMLSCARVVSFDGKTLSLETDLKSVEAHILERTTALSPYLLEIFGDSLEDLDVTTCKAGNAEQAWQSVLGQLQLEMPKASFDTWVRDTKPVSYQDGTLTIGVRNAYARDWLDSRLASTISRLLVGIMNDSVAVSFVVADQNNDIVEDDDSSSDDNRDEPDAGVALQLEADRSSDYFMEVRPDHCVMIEGYHQRLCEKGDETLTDLSLYIGFRQAVFPDWKRAGEPAELVRTVSVRKILEFAMCIGRSKFFELLPGKEIGSANKVIAGGHVEIKETRASTKEKFVDTNTYLVRMRPLLARVDATAVQNVIHERVAQTVEKDEARREALNVLYDLLNCDIGKWLVETADGNTVDASIHRTVAGIVEGILGEGLDDDLNKISDLLHEKIVNAFGMIKLTHYYIRIVVPTLRFSIAQSWAIAFARDRAWFDYKTMTQKDYVIAPNGIADLARWVGVTPKIVKKWLEEDKYFKCFVAMVDPSHSPDEKNTFFVVNHLEPMLADIFGGKPWRWDVREAVLDVMRLESRLEQDLPAREKEKLEQRINALRAKINEKLAQSNGKTWTTSRKNVDYHPEKRGLPHGKVWTTVQKSVDYVTEKYGLSEGKIRTTLDSYIKPQFNPSPALKNDKTNSTPTMQPTKNSLGMLRAKGVGEPDFSSFDWSLEGLLKRNRTSQIKRKEIRALQISFEGLLALTLYWGGITGQRRGIQNPYSYALSDLTTEVPDEYIDLAKLPPKEIFAHLVGGDRGRFASEIGWNRLMGDNLEYREKLLTTLFGIEFPERHPSEVVIRTTQITRHVD